MKITVIGGSRGSGAQVVKVAAKAGHQVTCLSRSGSASPMEGVRDLTGDALDAESTRRAVAGADAVVVAVGGAKGSNRHRTEVTKTVIAAMQEAGVRRLIVQSSLGVGDSMQLLHGPAKMFAKTVLGPALADHTEQEAAVEQSGLDWTVLRPGGLTNEEATGAYLTQETSEGRQMKGRIPRADVAAQIVDMLQDSTTFGRALAIGAS